MYSMEALNVYQSIVTSILYDSTLHDIRSAVSPLCSEVESKGLEGHPVGGIE